MIVAAHQPNFLPYIGFFYKIYCSDVFVISDTVSFSRRGFHHYNYFNENGQRKKITVPVSHTSGQIDEVLLSQWHYHKKKMVKRLKSDYARSPHYDQIMPEFEKVLLRDYDTLLELNMALLFTACHLLDIHPTFDFEYVLNPSGDTPTEQIADICHKTDCTTYLSGEGAMDYLDVPYLEQQGIRTLFTNYTPLQYGSLENLSVFDYLMNNGAGLPNEWELKRRRLRHGI